MLRLLFYSWRKNALHCTSPAGEACELPFVEEVWLATDCLLLFSSSARRAQERVAELQYELEASRDREVAAHDQLSRLTVQVCVGGGGGGV